MFKLAQGIINLHPNKGQFSDGYHTFNELYEIRKAYNVALFNEWAQQQQASETEFVHLGVPRLIPKYDVHKSWRHHDGELCFGGGWFIVMAILPKHSSPSKCFVDLWTSYRFCFAYSLNNIALYVIRYAYNSSNV